MEQGTREIAIHSIRPNDQQPRTVFDAEALADLASSIAQHGILQPVTVRPSGAGFELIAGERRWRAAQIAGLRAIPALVRSDVSDGQMLELALVENVQRQDLDAIERARGYQQMIERLGITQDEVARKVGLKRVTITNHLRLLDLPDEVQAAVSRGLVSMGHARAMVGIVDPAFWKELLEQIVRQDLSVRKVEEAVRQRGKTIAARSDTGNAAPSTTPAWVRSIEQRLKLALGTKVSVRNSTGFRGQIVIEYFGREDIDRLVDVLAPEETI